MRKTAWEPEKYTFNHEIFGEYVIVEVKDNRNIRIKFSRTGYECWKQMGDIRNGAVRDDLHRTKHGVGFIGQGPHVTSIKGKATLDHSRWGGMIERGYCKKVKLKHPSYETCKVDEQWHNFQEFAEWCQWQKGSKIKGWELDKDILKGGNMTYGPDTCCFVPAEINIQFRKTNKKNCLSGVRKISSGKYTVALSKGISYAGVFETQEEAFLEFKKQKEAKIKLLAEKYKEDLDERVYYKLTNFSLDTEYSGGFIK